MYTYYDQALPWSYSTAIKVKEYTVNNAVNTQLINMSNWQTSPKWNLELHGCYQLLIFLHILEILWWYFQPRSMQFSCIYNYICVWRKISVHLCDCTCCVCVYVCVCACMHVYMCMCAFSRGPQKFMTPPDSFQSHHTNKRFTLSRYNIVNQWLKPGTVYYTTKKPQVAPSDYIA